MKAFKDVSAVCYTGLFIAGYIFYSSSLIEPFFNAEFNLNAWQLGKAQSAVLFSAIFGSLLAGRLADLFGRKRLLNINFFLIILASLGNIFIIDFYTLCLARILNGFLAGTLYPLCTTYLIEISDRTTYARKFAILMFINCLAAPFAYFLFTLFMKFNSNEYLLWRLVLFIPAILAGIAGYFCLNLPILKNSHIKTSANAKKLKLTEKIFGGLKGLLHTHYRYLTFLLVSTWFLMDVVYYGINFFIPYLLSSINLQDIFSIQQTIWISFWINVFFVLGAISAIYLVSKIELVILQKYGFLLAASSLFVLGILNMQSSYAATCVILALMLFNFSLNMGPDVTTCLLSITIYPTNIRGSGLGFIAGIAKLGSFVGVLFLPKLQQLIGFKSVLLLMSFLLFIATFFTFLLQKRLGTKSYLKESYLHYETS